MTDRELKNMLKDAYKIEPSERERQFLRAHENRKRDLLDVISFELKNMGILSAVIFVVLCVFLFWISRLRHADYMWMFSSSLTLFAFFPTAIVGKSERYMMWEIETASRFSYRFLKCVRMFILGVISLVVIVFASLLLMNSLHISPIRTICFIGIPYLSNVCANIFVTRKIHSKEAIYICTGITMILCVIPYGIQYMGFITKTNPALMLLALIVIVAVTMKQSVLYVKESENIAWNLC
ncbi:MAG: hypothetical protein J5684_03625 [Eubacterium sp.]|nr:hypothetical protein [Eubacterium sp.]